MRVDHTPSSRSATIVAGLLVLVELLRAVLGTHDTYAEVLLLVLVLGTSAAVLRLHHRNCVESRLVVGLVAAVSGIGVVLTATAGLPGQEVRPLGLLGALTLALSITVIGLVVADPPGRGAKTGTRSPYAS